MFNLGLNVSAQIKVEKSAEEIFDFIGDFRNWRYWSPWLCLDPNCSVIIKNLASKEGHFQSWDGDLIGSGDMVLSRFKARESLEYNLTFLKPWKSNSTVSFAFQSLSKNQTCVTWTMKGTIPFFLFFLKKMMEALVASDYERGLLMLKEYLEKGRVDSKLSILRTPSHQGPFYWVGLRRTCTLKEMPSFMSEDFSKIFDCKAKNPSCSDPKFFFSIYHKYNLVNKTVEYTSGMAFEKKIDSISSLLAGQIPSHQAISVEHLGSYKFLGNAWAAAMSAQRLHGKVDKRVPMYEIYLNHPGQVEEKDLRTKIFVPVK